MPVTLYVLNDATAIEYVLDDDLDGLRGYISDDDTYVTLEGPLTFALADEAEAFARGVNFGRDSSDDKPAERLVLNASLKPDAAVIDIIIKACSRKKDPDRI